MHHIYQGERRQYAGRCAYVYVICSLKNKTKRNKSYRLYFQSKLTYLKLTQFFQIP